MSLKYIINLFFIKEVVVKIYYRIIFKLFLIINIFIYIIYSETSWEEVVNNRLPREIGNRNFHPRFNS